MKTAVALGAWFAMVVSTFACGGAPQVSPASPSEGTSSGATRGGGPGGGGGGDDPSTTFGEESGSRRDRERKADACLKKCYDAPATVSGDALRDMCEKQCSSKGSGTVQPPAK